MRPRSLTALLAASIVAPLAGCNGPGAAARDFLDPYRIVVGVGSGAGFRASSLGLFDTGLAFGVKPEAAALGWKYGRPFALQPLRSGLRFDADQSVIVETRSLVDADYTDGAYALGRRSFALFPALFTWVDSADPDRVEWTVREDDVALSSAHYLWSARTWRDERYAMIHAFDIETDIMIFGYLDVGYSPGEAVDFVLSLFGFDLAGDDDR